MVETQQTLKTEYICTNGGVKMKKRTQTEAILSYMQTHDGITSMEAFEKYGATRLSGLIYRLKKQGYNISTEMIECKNRFGETCHFAKYSLAEEQ